jgi:uncharacterized coiled-coil DUF342 family protein
VLTYYPAQERALQYVQIISKLEAEVKEQASQLTALKTQLYTLLHERDMMKEKLESTQATNQQLQERLEEYQKFFVLGRKLILDNPNPTT